MDRDTAELVTALHRDVRWLQSELKRIRDAKALNGDKLREIASASLEKSKARLKRTVAK